MTIKEFGSVWYHLMGRKIVGFDFGYDQGCISAMHLVLDDGQRIAFMPKVSGTHGDELPDLEWSIPEKAKPRIVLMPPGSTPGDLEKARKLLGVA